MPRFSYSALSQNGVLTRGEGVAASAQDLARELSSRGMLVQQVRAIAPALRWWRRQTVGPEDFLLFNQELIALIRAGLTIPDALDLVGDRPGNPGFSQLLRRVFDDVRGGALLSEACARHPEVFDPLYLSALRTGEKTGDLRQVLARYQVYLRQRVALRKKVGRALAYPLFLLVALVLILAVLFAFVLPRFVAMYADFGAALPWPTQVLLNLVKHLPLTAGVGALIGGSAWGAWRRWRATERGRVAIDRFKERIPYLGEIQREIGVSQLARSLAALLAAGTPLVDALRTVQGAISNRAYAERLQSVTEQVSHGEGLARALRAQALLPPTAAKMVEVGEASGNLDGMLDEVAGFYEESLDNRLARLMTLIEPVLMLLMGVLIGGIIIVMYLPIFNMAEVIR
ncbi:MAG: type II secretion system F family protein [Sulfurifustis sp.]